MWTHLYVTLISHKRLYTCIKSLIFGMKNGGRAEVVAHWWSAYIGSRFWSLTHHRIKPKQNSDKNNKEKRESQMIGCHMFKVKPLEFGGGKVKKFYHITFWTSI